MARIKREEHLRRDKTWRKRGQYEAKLAGLDHKGPQHVAALALPQPTIPLALLEAPSVDCVWDFIEQTNEEYDRLHGGLQSASSGASAWPCHRKTTLPRMSRFERGPGGLLTRF